MLKIAHRGALAERTENTLESFKAALEDGFDGIELDVRRCASGELVVFHDADLKRLANDPRKISETSWTELQTIRINGQAIPLLETVLEKLPATTLYIELKDAASVPGCAQLLSRPTKHSIVVGSMSIETLEKFQEAYDQPIDLGLITSRRPFVRRHKNVKLTHVGFHHWLTNWLGVWLAHRNGQKVFCYPIKSKLVERILVGHGIDGLVYDKKL